MEDNNNMFVILIRLKSYLISLIDTPDECDDSLEYAEEYLNRKYPEMSAAILESLKENEIYSDCQIVFDQDIQEKFKLIAEGKNAPVNLNKILEKFHIETRELFEKDDWNEIVKKGREDKIKQIVSVLLKTANEWINRKDIEENIDDISILIEEDVIREEEIEKLKSISNETGLSYSKLSTLTLIYLKLFVDYLFEFGGDVSLKNFQEKLTRISRNIDQKYNDLLKNSGLKKE